MESQSSPASVPGYARPASCDLSVAHLDAIGQVGARNKFFEMFRSSSKLAASEGLDVFGQMGHLGGQSIDSPRQQLIADLVSGHLLPVRVQTFVHCLGDTIFGQMGRIFGQMGHLICTSLVVLQQLPSLLRAGKVLNMNSFRLGACARCPTVPS